MKKIDRVSSEKGMSGDFTQRVFTYTHFFSLFFRNTMPRSKKGRLSGAQRQELNTKRAAAAVAGTAEGLAFGRVTKMLGAGHVSVAISSTHGPKTILARIPNVLSRKGATPITTRDVVTIYVGPGFNPDGLIRMADKFEITSVITSKQAYTLSKEGTIPPWMLAADGEEPHAAGAATNGAGGFEFDYAAVKEEGDEDTGDEDDKDDEGTSSSEGPATLKATTPAFSRKAARDAVDEETLDVDAI